MKTKKLVSLAVASVLSVSMLAGCGGSKDGKVSISIGNSPVEGQAGYENYMSKIESFSEAHPEWDVDVSTYVYSTDNFMAKAAAKQLPTSWVSPLTEIQSISNAGYCADVSENLKKAGLYDVIDESVLEIISGDNGEVWGIPTGFYAQGLHINKKLFKQAGLVNEDGTVKVPQTYDEIAEFSKIIKEKTGAAGLVLPTTDNYGGWHFINVAWSYGTEFMKQNDDGTWTATFDSDEFKSAVEWLYDLKWESDGLPEGVAVGPDEMFKLFATDQAAMIIAGPPCSDFVTKYDMAIEDIACVSLPACPEGRYAQTGGGVIMFDANATEEQIDAAIAWEMEYHGANIEITDEALQAKEDDLIVAQERGSIILPQDAMPMYKNRVGEDKLAELRQKYTNVDIKDYEDYFDFSKVTLRAEEPVCCQQLYAVMDKAIQEVLSNKDVNIDELIKTSVSDFQNNNLDNLK